MKRVAISVTGVAAVVGTFVSSASAINVQLDYGNDGGYLASIPGAQTTINKAAADISSFLTTTLNATVDTNSGTAPGGSSVTFDHSLTYQNPIDGGGTITVANAALAANTVTIFVGHRTLTGATLAQGGPGGYGFGASGGSASQSDFQIAVNNAASASTANLTRGGGPVMGTLSGSFNSGQTYSVSYGATLGNLWFDSDTNNDSTTDTSAQFANYFQTDYTQAVGSKVDLYSVALHELLHALGMGTSQSWNNDIGGDGNDWTGANVDALVGSGNNNAVTTDGHIAISSSTNAFTGAAQTPVMYSSIGAGQRRGLTVLDAAFLRDIGWQVTVPEPTSLAAMAVFAIGIGTRRRRA